MGGMMWDGRMCGGSRISVMMPVSRIRSADRQWQYYSKIAHLRACDNAEKWIEINTEDEKKRLIETGRLCYDKRKTGNGLVLSRDVPALNAASAPLLAGDQLLAQKSLPDTAKYGSIVPPIKLCFWRKSDATLCKRRNPMFGEDIGVTIGQTYSVDYLHTVCFGPEAFVVLECFWRSVESNAISGGGEHHACCEQAMVI
eukprot:8480486-Pyramimonas_sp.AAC.1